MAIILDGKKVAAALDAGSREKVEALIKIGVTPTLAIVRTGEQPDDIAYERAAIKRCEKIGVAVKCLKTITEANEDPLIHGCLQLGAQRTALLPSKDIDGFTAVSQAAVYSGGNAGFAPCTAQACMEILRYYDIELAGKKAVVIGRSLVVGKPVAMLLLGQNATVTICHSKTEDMASLCQSADILVVAAGRRGIVGAGYVHPRQIVIDVGTNVAEDGRLVGDVDFAAVEPVVHAITTVPGGVGAVTNSVLIRHVIEAALL